MSRAVIDFAAAENDPEDDQVHQDDGEQDGRGDRQPLVLP
jgi:hypothetical protein